MNLILQKTIYSCDQVKTLLYDYLDETLPTLTSMRFHLHLNLCSKCREYLFLYKKAANAKAFRLENPAPEEFLKATLEFLKKEGIVDQNEK